MLQHIWPLFTRAFAIFGNVNAMSRGAAIAFYTVTSIAPVLLIVIAVAGFVFGQQAATGAIFAQFSGLLGAQNADLLQQTIASAAESKPAGVAASVISVAGLILTASGVFLELEDALNGIWETKTDSGFLSLAQARIASLGLVVALGFVLMVSLVIDAGLKGFSGVIDANLPFGSVLLMILSFAISYLLITLIFGAIYKLLPAVPIAWRDVVFGAAVTGLLFEIGKFLIGLYLGSNTSVSSLGAAGALLGLLFWVYYSALIFLFGAAVTKAYAELVTGSAPEETKADHAAPVR